MKILRIWISRAGLEVLGDPSGAKMAQDASWISSGAEFGDVLGLILSPAKMAPRLRYVGQLGAQDGQLGTILGGIFGHISDLERDLSRNSRSVKTTNTTTLLVVFRGSGARLEGPLGAILDDVGSDPVQ